MAGATLLSCAPLDAPPVVLVPDPYILLILNLKFKYKQSSLNNDYQMICSKLNSIREFWTNFTKSGFWGFGVLGFWALGLGFRV